MDERMPKAAHLHAPRPCGIVLKPWRALRVFHVIPLAAGKPSRSSSDVHLSKLGRQICPGCTFGHAITCDFATNRMSQQKISTQGNNIEVGWVCIGAGTLSIANESYRIEVHNPASATVNLTEYRDITAETFTSSFILK